jgi:hypothetical protein
MGITRRRHTRPGGRAAAALCTLALTVAGCGSQRAVTVGPPATAPSTTSTTLRVNLGPAGPPSRHAVAGGRYIHPVVVTGLRISPPAPGSTLGLGWARARALFEAVTDISGIHQYAILGAATVTLTGIRLPHNGRPLRDRPAWVGIAWGGIVNCPAMPVPGKGAPTTTPTPYQPTYTAVVIYGDGGSSAIVYTGRGSPACGGALEGPTVATAMETVSVAWTQVGPPSKGSVPMDYRAPSCATVSSTGGGGNVRTGRITLTIDLAVPFDHTGCGPATTHRLRYQYVTPHMPSGVPTFHDPTFLHGPTGLVRALQRTSVVGGGST